MRRRVQETEDKFAATTMLHAFPVRSRTPKQKKKSSGDDRIVSANIEKTVTLRHTTSRHGRARRAMTTASTATKRRTRGENLWAYRAVSVS